jgi:translation initiation factor IF-2
MPRRYNDYMPGGNDWNNGPKHQTASNIRPSWGVGVDDELQDISQLRNAFMRKNAIGREQFRNDRSGQGTWRNGNVPAFGGGEETPRWSIDGNNATSSPSPSSSRTAERHPEADRDVGGRWMPSFYKKRSTMPQSPSVTPRPPVMTPSFQMQPTIRNDGGDDVGQVKSMERVMRENAIQRHQNMEQIYINAGQRVPYNSDEFGNAKSNNAGGAGDSQRFGWRNQNKNSAAGGGQYNQNYQHRQQYQKSPYNNRTQQQQSRQERQRKQIRKHLSPSTPKEVRLPSSPLGLVDLSLLLRVRKRTIVRTLRSLLNEPIAYTAANQDSYKIDPEMMEFICVELGIEPVQAEKRKDSDVEMAERRALRRGVTDSDKDDEARTKEDEEREELYASLPPRSPVISIMGHVDHGKTTLMDALRRRAVTAAAGGKTSGGKTEPSGKKQKKNKNGESSSSIKSKRRGVDVADDNVAGTEAGGITQVITAFEVPLPPEEGATAGVVSDGQLQAISTVTFLDTPGHAAFKKMRQSGSLATDVIVLVVAADDGLAPQTIEIIDMFKSIARSQPQSVSLVIAVSKIDKPGIDVDEAVMRIENQLMEHEIFTENVIGSGNEGEFGACQLFPVSGITGEGLDDLVEGLALQAEIMDLRADENAMGEGIVIDARMERGLGVVAECIIRWGSVSKGDFVVSGTNGGRVKFLNDVGNKAITKARPSQPVRIVGFKTLPRAGDPIVCAKSEDEARELIRLRESELINEDRGEFEKDVQLQITGTAAKQHLMMQKAQQKYGFDGGDVNEKADSIWIPVVIKADSHGSLEAVRDALISVASESKLDIVIDPVEMSTGVITMSDVVMARESDAAIFAFGNVGVADKETKTLAETDGVSIRSHDIVYRLLEDAKEFFVRYLPVQLEDKVHGKGLVQAVFDVTDSKKQSVSIAGLRVTDGYLYKGKSKARNVGEESLPCFYRVVRHGKLMTSDIKLQASSLRKAKDDVDSVRNGEECGLGLIGFNDLMEGDVVECFSIEEKRAAI